MGIYCTLWQVTPQRLYQLRSSEKNVVEFIDFCFPETYDDDEYFDTSKTNEYYEKDLDLDKMWHLLHFLLTGDENSEEYPLAYAISVGYSIGETWSDLTFREPHEVKDIAVALKTISKKKIRKRCQKESLADRQIYKYLDYDLNDNEIDEILDFFSKLREFYIDASREGNAVLSLIN